MHHASLLPLAVCLALPLAAQEPQRPAASAPTLPPVQWLDLDLDGYEDFILTVAPTRARAFHNRGDGGFDDVTEELGLGAIGMARQLSFADYDGDGDPDALVVRPDGGLTLLENRAGEAFVERTQGSGLEAVAGVSELAWMDYDRDGQLDLILTTASGAHIFRGVGEGTFAAAWTAPEEPAAAPVPRPAPVLVETPDQTPAPAASTPKRPTATPQETTSRPASTSASQHAGTASRRLPLAPAVGATPHAPSASGRTAFPTCARTIRDVTTGQCLFADSTPTLGRLYPLSQDFNLDASGNVGIGTATPTAKLTVAGPLLRQVARTGGLGPQDGTDNGRLMSRTLSFTKTQASTAIRVSYSDNFRAFSFGSPVGGRWEVRVDGAAPPGGSVVFDFYVDNGNTHRASTFVGYLEGVPAGTHTIEIWVGPVPGYPTADLFTGWADQTWTLEAEEVF